MGWVEVIHKCKTPSVEEVKAAEVQVGSRWACDGKRPGTDEPCEDQWLLRQIECPPGTRGNIGSWPKWQRLTENGEQISGPGTAGLAGKSEDQTLHTSVHDRDVTLGRTPPSLQINPGSLYHRP